MYRDNFGARKSLAIITTSYNHSIDLKSLFDFLNRVRLLPRVANCLVFDIEIG